MSDMIRVPADYGKVWHLVEGPRTIYQKTLCGKETSRANRPRTDKVCRDCERLAKLVGVPEKGET